VTEPRRGPSIASWFDQFRGFEPDARRFLLFTIVAGTATGLWWIDFNLYLAARGISPSGIGLVATVGSIAAALAALPASSLSDRLGRRLVMLGGTAAAVLAVLGLAFAGDILVIVVLAALFGAGTQATGVVAAPYMSEHSRPEQRSELFALQFALNSATNVLAAAIGGIGARALADRLALAPESAETYRLILGFMAALLTLSLFVIVRLSDDRPATLRRRVAVAAGEPSRFPPPVRPSGWSAARLGLTIRDRRAFARILLPGFLISIGAGQVIPFLNLFVRGKFGLDLVALNGVFAITSLGTMLAILFQPTIARRFGRLRSVILVQGASIPFLLVLGFSPVLWTVIAAMAVRNSLMNAGNPIFTAFAMDRVSRSERATLAAAMSLLWSAGWVIAGAYYSIVQAVLGFDAGYALNFMTIIVLYSIATFLYWHWFRHVEGETVEAAPLAA
jgi:MFS family permease